MPLPQPRIGFGVCRRCGCTDEAACLEGCYWIDASHTLCSQCATQGDLVATGLDHMTDILRMRPLPGIVVIDLPLLPGVLVIDDRRPGRSDDEAALPCLR